MSQAKVPTLRLEVWKHVIWLCHHFWLSTIFTSDTWKGTSACLTDCRRHSNITGLQETYILPTPSPRIAHYRHARYPQVPDLPPGRAPIHLHLHIYPRRLPSLARSQQDRVSRGTLYGSAHLALEESLANAFEPDANGWQSSWHFLARSSHRRKAQSICELMLCCNGRKFPFSDRSKSTEALTLF